MKTGLPRVAESSAGATGSLASTREPRADEAVDRQERESRAALKTATQRSVREGVPGVRRAGCDRVLTASSVAL